MSRYLAYVPVGLAVFAIFGLTAVQFAMTDRLSDTNVSAEQRAELLKRVPQSIGDWKGEDIPVDPTIQQRAGAVGAVSRVYRNVRTGDTVDLWLIVGHARGVVGHTPDICYPSSGFEKRADENSTYIISARGQPDAPFLTNTFFKEDVTGRRLVRVFWAWYDSQGDQDRDNIEWEGPQNPRIRFGNTRALYKIYFTSEMRDSGETADQSVALRFAQEALPVVNYALSEVYSEEEIEALAEASVADGPPSPPAAEEAEETVSPESPEVETDFDADLETSTDPAADLFDNLFDDTESKD